MRCAYITLQGSRCKRVVGDGRYCFQHGSDLVQELCTKKAPNVKAKRAIKSKLSQHDNHFIFKDYMKYLVSAMTFEPMENHYLRKMGSDITGKDKNSSLKTSEYIKLFEKEIGIRLYAQKLERPNYDSICKINDKTVPFGFEIKRLSNLPSNKNKPRTVAKFIKIEKLISNGSADGIIYRAIMDTTTAIERIFEINPDLESTNLKMEYGNMNVIVKKSYYSRHEEQASLDACVYWLNIHRDSITPHTKKELINELMYHNKYLRDAYNNDEYVANMETISWFQLALMNYTGSTPFFPYVYGSFLKRDSGDWHDDLSTKGQKKFKMFKNDEEEEYDEYSHRLCCLTVMEELDGTIDNLIDAKEFLIVGKNGKLQFDTSTSFPMLLQLFFGLMCGYNMFGFVHNDLHAANVMYKDVAQKYIYYRIIIDKKEVFYKIPTNGHLLKIMDYGRGAFKCDKLDNLSSETYKNWFSDPKDKWSVHNDNADLMRFLSFFESGNLVEANKTRTNDLYDNKNKDHTKLKEIMQLMTCKKTGAFGFECETLAQIYNDCLRESGKNCKDNFLITPYKTSKIGSYGIKNPFVELILTIGTDYTISKIPAGEIVFDVEKSKQKYC